MIVLVDGEIVRTAPRSNHLYQLLVPLSYSGFLDTSNHQGIDYSLFAIRYNYKNDNYN